MADHDRSELFSVLSELARRYPHWRVGQLVANVAGWADAEVWDAEDEKLLSAARMHISVLSSLTEANSGPNQPFRTLLYPQE